MGKLAWPSMVAGILAVCQAAPVASQEKLTASALAALIDRRLSEKGQGVQPAPLTDDSEFLRRVYLDVAGRIPRVKEVRDFLEDGRSDRRQRAVEELLGGPQYVKHFSTTWRNLLLPPNNNQRLDLLAGGFKPWLEEQVRNNTAYDTMVRDLLTAPLNSNNGSGPYSGPSQAASPAAFFFANEQKPENLAASTSRIFMGVKLECAQCHDHPFALVARSVLGTGRFFLERAAAGARCPRAGAFQTNTVSTAQAQDSGDG